MSPPDARESLVGRTIGHYAVGDRLGRGGMGAVYLARDTRLNREVAIKVIDSGAERDPALAKRLLREARAASALNHPNIVTIHEIAEADGLDYIVMERVEGRPLAELIPPGGLPVDQVVDLATQIASAVAAAHGAHIVHRDLKPGNVMVTPGGRVKVLDFGLARFQPPTVLDEAASTAAMPTRLTGPRTILGTAGYMSPEQIEGRPVQEPSDVFSLGVMLYEMLTGRPPFAGNSAWAVLGATVQGTPQPVQSLRPDTSAELARIVARCLGRRPEDRYPSAGALAEDLQKLAARPATAGRRPSRAMLVAGLALAAVAVALPTWLLVRESRARWARGAALAEMAQRTTKRDLVGAFAVARKAMAIATQDPRVRDAWDHLVTRVDLESQPAGAEVAIHSYVGGDGWLPLGRTPLKEVSVPFGFLRWRLVRPGYDTLVVGQGHDLLEFTLARSGTSPPGMVLVPGGSVQVESTGEPIVLPEFWLDRCEVTNGQYKAFVDAGGYRRREFWKEPLIRDGRAWSWEEAMATFRDATGRPGPATWEFGSYPAGHADDPVTGVSWYEAAAFAAYAGRQLPTVYHWYRASGSQGVFSEIVAQSNFSAKGPARAGSMAGLGPFGTYDMAGNAKEWCWNAADGHRRYILGGGWNELVYAFHDQDARAPIERDATFGFRCMLQREPMTARLTAPLPAFVRDPATLVPVGDEVFQVYRRLYDYDPTPLEARVESVNDRNPAWREELVTVRTAYGSERLPIHVYVPKSASPPYQAVVLFPGSNAVRSRSSQELPLRMSDFHTRAGRVLVYPIYQGTYERRTPGPKGRNELRDIMIQRGKDVRRTVDYLTTRPDIDTTRISFYGISLGAQLGPLFLVIEPRFRAGVLFSGGFETWDLPPECDPVNFTPRVRAPVLMVNGREDFDLPYESAQVPMFRMLGTPPGQKQHVVLAGGHIPLHPGAAIRAMSEWLDARFGAPR